MSLLTIIQAVCDLEGLPRLTSAVPSTDTAQAMQRTLFALAKQEGEELVRRAGWRQLATLHTITVSAGASAYALPSDLGRMVPGAMWDATGKQPVRYCLTPADWQDQVSWGVSASPWMSAIRRGDYLLFYPLPSTSRTVTVEYQSSYYATSSAGTAKAAWTADSDLGRLPESLMVLGIRWRWRQSQGLDYQGLQLDWERRVQNELEMSRAGAPRYNLAGPDYRSRDPRCPNLPETGYS